MYTLNGGWYDYPNRSSANIFGHKEDTETAVLVVKQGQVLKARTFLQSITSGADKGKCIARGGLSEAAIVTFAAITAGQTLILGGLTFTAGSGGTSASKLVTIWGGLASGIGFAAAAANLLLEGIDATVDGTFTAGTFGAWETTAYDDNTVVFTGTAGLSNVADLADTGTATDPVISKVDGATSLSPISGITVYDVDATAGDVSVACFIEADFRAEALTWAVDPASDTIAAPDGTTVACTPYNTGTLASDFATTRRLQTQYVEGSKFSHLTFTREGEKNNG